MSNKSWDIKSDWLNLFMRAPDDSIFDSEHKEVTIEYDQQNDHAEDGVVVPMERINPDTLRKMVEEFVTREWSELSDADCTFEDNIELVIQQLKDKKIKVVFDLTSETCNIVTTDTIRSN